MSQNAELTRNTPGLKVFHKGLILVLVPLVIEIVLITSLAFLLVESDKESIREAKFRQCAAYSAKLIALANEAVIAAFGAYQGDARIFIRVYDQDMKGIEERTAKLRKCAKGDPRSEKAAKQLIDSLNDLSPVLDKVIQPAREGKRILEISGNMKNIQNEFSSRREVNMERMSSVTRLQENVAEDSRKRCEVLQTLQFKILAFGLCANFVAGFLLILFYRNSIMHRLKVIMGNTLRLAERMELSPLLSGSDEISQLDAAFHMMDRDLRKAAERERALFENVSDVICVLNRELRFVKINPACDRSWGFTPEELLGEPIDKVIEPGKLASSRNSFDEAVHNKLQSDLEISILRPDTVIIETLWSTYYSESEGTLYCVVHDITERKQVERTRQSFITMMSSDLRQPLTRISEDISALLGPLMTEISEKARARLETAKTNSVRLISLVNDLLQLTQTGVDTLDAHRTKCSIEELLKRSAQDLEGLAQKSKIEFAIDCKAQECFADPDKIIQVIVNLGSNAIKFSPAGATVTLKAQQDGDFVRIEVVDKGRGIPESHRQAVFEKFKQVEAADGKRKAGTGLGLPICKDMVEQNAGAIGVDSQEGQGSTFWFTLPVSEEIFSRIQREKLAAREEERKALAQRNTSMSQITMLPSRAPGTNMSLYQKGLLLIGVPVLFEIIFVLGITALLLQTDKSRTEESHQREIAQSAYEMLDAYFTNSLNIVHTKSFESWLEFDKVNEDILRSGKRLKKLIAEDNNAKVLFAPAEKFHDKMVVIITSGRQAIAEQGYDKARAAKVLPDRFELWAVAAGISKRLGKLIDETERKEFISPKKQIALRRGQGILLGLGLFGNVLLSLFLARFFSKDLTTRLAVQADNAGRLARDMPLNPVFPGTDEIAKLDRAFHHTAEKLAEARRKERAILDNSRDLICVLDQDAKFLNSNPACEEIFACSKEELSARSLIDLISEVDKDAARKLLSEDLSSGEFRELRLDSRDGRSVHVMLSLNKPRGQENIFCIAHDISHRKELEQLKQDFLAMVSHDLRSPLTSMTGTAALIEEGGTGAIGESAKARVHDIILQGEQLIELINDLLDLEKLEAGKMELILTRSSSADFLEKACEITQSRFSKIQIDLGEALDEEMLQAEFDRLVQALTNILSFMAARLAPGAVLKVSAQKSEQELNWIMQDSGPALSAEERQRLFEREFAARLIAKLQHEIDSLHLSILALPLANEIIEAHHGRIEVVVQPGGSNKIIIKLPSNSPEEAVT